VDRSAFTQVCGALALGFALSAKAEDPAHLLGVRVGGDDRTSGVVIQGDRPLSFTTLKLASPPRVVVDFADTEVTAKARELAIDDGTLRRAAIAQAGERTARVVIELAADAEFDVRTDGNDVEVRVPRPAAVAAAEKPAEPTAPLPGVQSDAEAEKVASLPQVSLVGSPTVTPDSDDPRTERQRTAADRAEALKKTLAEKRALGDSQRHKAARRDTAPVAKAEPAEAARDPTPGDTNRGSAAHHVPYPARHITGIGFRPVRGGEVIVRSDHPLEYGISGDDGALLLHLPSAAIPLLNNRRPLDTRFFGGPVSRVVPLEVAGGTDVRIELREHAEYQLEQSGSVLTVTFSESR